MVLTGYASPVSAWRFNAQSIYSLAGGDNRDTASDFQQRFTLSFGPALNLPFRPSHALSASFGLSYSRVERRVERSDRSQTTTREDVVPSFRVSLVNDIFAADFSGYQTFKRTQNDYDSRDFAGNSGWQASLLSAWDEPLWPKLSFEYGLENFDTGETLFANKTDRQSRNLSLSVDWDLKLASLYYTYRQSEFEVDSSNSLNSNDSHYVRFATGTSLFSNRLRVGTTQQWKMNSRESSSEASALDTLHGLTRFATTDPDVLLEPLPGGGWTDGDVNLNDYPELRDYDYFTPITDVEASPGERIHLSFENNDPFSPGQRIDLIRVTLAPSTVEATVLSLLEWDLYIKERDPFDYNLWEWVRTTEKPVAIYNAERKQLEIPINRYVEEVMLVAVNQSAVDTVSFTEVQAFISYTTPFGNSSSDTFYKSSYSLSYRITDSLSTSFGFSFDQTDYEQGPTSRNNTKTSHSARLSWSPYSFLSTSVAYHEGRETETDSADKLVKNYSLNLSSKISPALNVSLGASHGESFLADFKTLSRNNLSLSTRGLIYPDLTGRWTLSYSDSIRFSLGDADRKSESISSSLSLDAQLLEQLRADFRVSCSETDTDGETKRTGVLNLHAYYRPSDLLALHWGHKNNLFANSRREESLGVVLGLITNDKTRLTLSSTHTQRSPGGFLHRFALSGNWRISRYLTLRGTSNYNLLEQGNFYSMRIDLSLNI